MWSRGTIISYRPVHSVHNTLITLWQDLFFTFFGVPSNSFIMFPLYFRCNYCRNQLKKKKLMLEFTSCVCFLLFCHVFARNGQHTWAKSMTADVSSSHHLQASSALVLRWKLLDDQTTFHLTDIFCFALALVVVLCAKKSGRSTWTRPWRCAMLTPLPTRRGSQSGPWSQQTSP